MPTKNLYVAIVLSLAIAVPNAAQAQGRQTRHEQKQHEQQKKKNTLLGVGLGLLGGAILSGGDPWATLSGAAAGGIIGNTTTKRPDNFRGNRKWNDRPNSHRRDNDRRDRRPYDGRR